MRVIIVNHIIITKNYNGSGNGSNNGKTTTGEAVENVSNNKRNLG